MKNYQLGDFLHEFLTHQGLHDFRLSLEPARRGSRRAKRSNSQISAEEPFHRAVLGRARSALHLFERLYTLAPKIKEWVEGGQYRLQLLDDVGVLIREDALLGDLRNRAELRVQEGERKSRKALLKAIQSCEKLLEPGDVDRVIKAILADRKGK